MTEEYTKIYCESMAKSLEDKLFFLNEIDINEYDCIVDFGCADGRILEVLDEKLTNRKTILIGIEKNKVMFDQLVSLAGRAKHTMLVSTELNDGDNEIFNLLKREGKKSLIIFSSVLHEYDWENLKEWLTSDYVFHVLYEKDYILPFIKQDIANKFGYELNYPTHKQIIFVRD